MKTPLAICIVFFGCCSNVVFLEALTRDFPKSGNLITFAAFIFNALEGFIFTSKFLTKPSVIPLRSYMTMVILFFVVQTINNYVLGLNISMPLQMIFRSGSLVANLIMGYLVLKRRYKISKYFSVMLITVGIMLCTCASVSEVEMKPNQTNDVFYDYIVWCLGLTLMMISLFLSASMGIFQEQIYAKYGKHPSEALFYNHLLPLPGFLLLTKDIYNQVSLYSASTLVTIWSIHIPWTWIYLFFNTITQYLCIRAVFVLTTECSSLTVTLVVTLRKFVSLIISIIYFNNPFTFLHWIGTLFVFGGTLIFTDVILQFKGEISGKSK